jgi:hypothetical protein
MFKHIEPWQPYHDFVHYRIGPVDFIGFFRKELQSLSHPEFREALYNFSNSQQPQHHARLKLQLPYETLLTGRSWWIHLSSFPP